MFTDLIKFLTDLFVSFRTVFRIGSVPAREIDPQADHMKVNFGALIVATILYYGVSAFLLGMQTQLGVGGSQAPSIFGAFFVNLVFVITSTLIVFLVSLATAVADATPAADIRADKWGTLLTHVWVVSLAALGIDLLFGVVFGARPLGYILGALLGGPFDQSGQPDRGGDVVRAIFYTIVAVTFVIVRSKIFLKRRILSASAVFSIAVALVFNSAFFFFMVYELPRSTSALFPMASNTPTLPPKKTSQRCPILIEASTRSTFRSVAPYLWLPVIGAA